MKDHDKTPIADGEERNDLEPHVEVRPTAEEPETWIEDADAPSIETNAADWIEQQRDVDVDDEPVDEPVDERWTDAP